MPLRKKKFFGRPGSSSSKASAASSERKDSLVSPNGFRLGRHFSEAAGPERIDPQTGERRYSVSSETSTLVGGNRPVDPTDLLHSLSRRLSLDSDTDTLREIDRPPGEPQIESLSSQLWRSIIGFMSVADAASLAFSSKTLMDRIGSEPWAALKDPGSKKERIQFLVRLDRDLPAYLHCFPCAKYHLRTQYGEERLKINYVNNPLFNCPLAQHTKLPRMRLTHGRELPFAFVQLMTRAKRFGRTYGLPQFSLDRRWKCSDSEWSHNTRYIIHKGHLLVRVVSQCPAPADITPTGERMLLFERGDFWPYFSCCAHWKDGELSKICKCALRHIPKAPETFGQQFKKGYNFSVSTRYRDFTAKTCEDCRDIRRCPECPTEYMIELKMIEDRSQGQAGFKHAIVVTRWSDLGDGTSPYSPEWASCNGENEERYDSFAIVGKRTISGTFESEVSNHLFLKRVLSLNPKAKGLLAARNHPVGETTHYATSQWRGGVFRNEVDAVTRDSDDTTAFDNYRDSRMGLGS
ncbi:MAG: hypothetical protein M1820_006780 [Bogoriella megaspora]|nr:MAG: hypothetical protein M1820_006780 [Bogoriella megaspora]